MRIRKKTFFNPNIEYLKKAFEENLPKECILRLFNIRNEIQSRQIPPLAFVQERAKTMKNKSNIKCNIFESASDVPNPRELNPENKNLMIFDDLPLEKQHKCEFTFFVEGIVMKTAFTSRKTISSYPDKLSD